MKNIFLKIITIMLVVILSFTFTTLQANSASIINYTVTLFEGGNIEVQGNISSGANKQITFLVHKPGSLQGIPQTQLMDYIAYIDQVTSTTNGTFLIRFTLNPKWQGQQLQFNVGGEDVSEPLRKLLTIPNYPINIGSVENNSVRVGIDVFHLSSPYYTPNTLTDAIVKGGNTLYFKIGDKWYNLLDSRATSAKFFVASNAIDNSTVNTWRLDILYPRNGLETIKFDPILINN